MKFVFNDRARCELCGSKEFKTLLSVPFSDPRISMYIEEYYLGRIKVSDLGDNRYIVRQCLLCQFIWQGHVFDDEGLKYLYETAIDNDASLAKSESVIEGSLYSLGREVAYIEGFFPGNRSGSISVLDYGMGWGHWARIAAAYGYDVTGVELSDRRLQMAQNMGLKTETTTHVLPDGSFHVIRAEQSLEHVPGFDVLWAEWQRLLSADGILMIGVPDGTGSAKILGSKSWHSKKGPTQPLEHVNTFTHKTLKRLAKKFGFRQVYPRLVGSRARRVEQLPYHLVTNLRMRRGTRMIFRKQLT
jgi:predicted SAM-dependent methyltransferase